MSHSMSSPRNIQLVFETYQKARLVFVQTMAELATRSTNVKCLESAGVLDFLRPLLSDPCSTVRQCALVAAARLAEHDEGVSRHLLNGGMVSITLENLNKYNVYYKRSALFVIRAVAKHSEDLAAAVVRLGALEHVVNCLEDFDTQVKENAAWALGYIGKHNEYLAGLVVDAGTLPLLILAFQEPEMSLKQISAGALVDLAQHKPEAVVDAGAICHLVRGLENQDPKLKRSILSALGAVAGARPELAEAVVAGGVLPQALLHAGHDAAPVRRAATCLIRDIVKHSVDLAQLIVNTGGCGPLVDLLQETTGGTRVPACMALGYIAGQSDQLAMAVIEAKTIPLLVEILQNPEAEDAELCAAAWTLGHIAKHSPQHSMAVAVANALPRLLQLYTSVKSSPEVRARASCALKQALQCCLHRPALEPLLHAAPACILKYVLAQYAKILPNDARARRLFVSTGALKRVQEIDSVPGTSLKEYINIINSCFPEEIVRYYTPGYSDALLDRVEAYTPQSSVNITIQIDEEEQQFYQHLSTTLRIADLCILIGLKKFIMRLKYSKTVMEAQDCESPIADVSWSPNNVKLAVATCERAIIIFDREGVRRDKFNTKPADPAAGKKSYVITSISFSDNSELLGVAQTDNMVFVYRVGADWAGKKVICNKFPLSGAPLRLLPADSGFYTGTTDGKIRTLDCKSNKSSSMWTGGSCCVSLARGGEGTLASGHVDGTLYVNGRMLLRYALPPTALILLPPYLIVGACDGRVAVYEAQRGALLRTIEPQLPPDRKDIICAEPSPSGQTIVMGTFDGLLVGAVGETAGAGAGVQGGAGGVSVNMLRVPRLLATRALAWSGDGTQLAIASQAGALILLEAVLRRWTWRGAVEVQHVSARQVVARRLAGDAPPLALSADTDIHSVRFIGNDWYAVCRTASTLILGDIARGLTSEIPWTGSGERIYAAVGGACLIHRAGELSVVEYGLDKVLHTVRTERVNPHVLSVRINEGAPDGERERDRKHLAYLLDRQTIAVVDLVTGVQLGQWWHEARVDWLELNEGGRLLLLRDTRRRLLLLRLDTGDKEIIASGVGFVQWIENSDAVVAQTPTHLLIWYSAWDAGSVEMAECGGGVAVEVSARRVIFEGGTIPYLQLDEHRLAFNNALRVGDLSGCARYLGEASARADVAPLWRQLALRALSDEHIQLAAKCYREIGDDARTFYLDETVELAAREGDGDVSAGLNSPVIRARLAIFAGDLATAEECYVKRANRPDLAINMYKQFNRWTDAIALAEKTDRATTIQLKQQHMDYLISTGRLGEAGAAVAGAGDAAGAVRLWVRGGRARRAAALLLQQPALLRDDQLLDLVHAQLLKEEWWEMAGEISERKGDVNAAVDYYARGNNYARAVQLAREACPAEVTRLEGQWGRWLVAARQAGAAVPHLIEAGETRAALAAALRAHHYKRALQIVQVIDDKESIKEECEQLGDHFISVQEWETAERVLSSCGMAERCVRAYNAAGRVAEGLRLAAGQLTEEQTRDIYLPLAQQLREDGQLRKAEQIYIGLGEADEAISMYKDATQYEAMLRLVAAHRSSLLEATRRHVAQALHASGDLRAAENYYIQAGDWKSAIQMYRTAGQWENAERVARAHAPSNVQQQVALQWAAALGGAPAARLLAARGLAALGARWALQAQRWDIAMELSELGGGITRREVTRHEAAALAEERPEEAEAAFLRAGAPEDAVRMWAARQHHQRALQLAEQHADHMVEEVLVEGARAAAERGDLTQFETLMIRANRPREVVQHYKDLELWEEATRVSREYLPDSAEPVPPSVPPLLQSAAEHADRGEWWEAVELLIAASAAGAAGGAARLAERAALRAGRLARDQLRGAARRKAAHMLAQRFSAIGQSDVGEQLRSALVETYGADEETEGASSEYADEEPAGRADGRAGEGGEGSEGREGGEESAALERLARAGHWQRCLAHAGHRAPHYAMRYAAHLFKAHERIEGVDIDSEEIPEALSQVLDTLRQYLVGESAMDFPPNDASLVKAICSEILVRISLAPKALSAMKDAATVLLVAGASDRVLQALALLMALHVPQIAPRAARALPRYTDIIVADVAYYACGVAVRAEGAGSAREAFVLLNRSLDLAEAAEDDSTHLLDFSDFECTDWSRSPLLLETACVRGAALDEVREWVLSVSMDQSVEQTLPVDSRGMYASKLGPDDACCVLTGYPLGSRLVTFTNGRCANREWWSRVVTASRGAGGGSGGAAPALLAFIQQWCGPADYSQI